MSDFDKTISMHVYTLIILRIHKLSTKVIISPKTRCNNSNFIEKYVSV